MNLSAGNIKLLYRGLLGASIALLTAFAAAAPAFAWTDTLNGSTPVRKVHMDELRTAVYNKVVNYGFGGPSWTDPTITVGSTRIRAVHVTQLQAQLNLISAYFNGWCPGVVPAAPAWNSITAGSSLIRGADFTQLRNYHDSIGAASGCCPLCRYPAGYSACAVVGNGTIDPYGRCGPFGCGYDDYTGVWTSYSYACNGAATCVYTGVATTCNGGSYYCLGQDLYQSGGGCSAASGCGGAYIQTCPASGYFCSSNNRYQYTGCSGDTCASTLTQNCGGNYYCSGNQVWLNGCSAAVCTPIYSGTCGTSSYCLGDGCNLHYEGGCYGAGLCNTYDTNCCGPYGGYCSGGNCY